MTARGIAKFKHRDRCATEYMDDPDCDLAKLYRTYAQFKVVNRVVAGWQQTYRTYVRPLLHQDKTNTLLDIGAGGADVTRAIAHWARRDGLVLHITAADPDDRAYTWAMHHQPDDGLQYVQALSSDLVAQGDTYHVVISNHLVHHLNDDALQGLLRDSQQLATRRAIHCDIRRSRVAYTLFSIGTWPFFPGSFIRQDGLTSIRRSYTAAELRAVAAFGWRVIPQRPWRNLLLYDAIDHENSS